MNTYNISVMKVMLERWVNTWVKRETCGLELSARLALKSNEQWWNLQATITAKWC